MTKYQLQAGPVRLSEFRGIAGLPKASNFAFSLHGDMRKRYEAATPDPEKLPPQGSFDARDVRPH